jgi:hypothetical protein
MNIFGFKRKVAVGLFGVFAIFLSRQMMGQGIILASNYDGTNFDGSSRGVGYDNVGSSYTYAIGASFMVAGSGSFELTSITMPVFIDSVIDGIPNSANYQISIVGDNGGQPTGDLVGSFTPAGVGFSEANDIFNITGVVQGGMNYWLVFSPIAPDSGAFEWNLAWSPTYIGEGYLARQWSSGISVPSGSWQISTGSGAVQPAFLIQGMAVPEPGNYLLLGLGGAGLAMLRRQTRPTTGKS